MINERFNSLAGAVPSMSTVTDGKEWVSERIDTLHQYFLFLGNFEKKNGTWLVNRDIIHVS